MENSYCIWFGFVLIILTIFVLCISCVCFSFVFIYRYSLCCIVTRAYCTGREKPLSCCDYTMTDELPCFHKCIHHFSNENPASDNINSAEKWRLQRTSPNLDGVSFFSSTNVGYFIITSSKKIIVFCLFKCLAREIITAANDFSFW